MTFSFLQWKFQNELHNVKNKTDFLFRKAMWHYILSGQVKKEKCCVLALLHRELGKLKCNLKLSPPRRVCQRIIRIYSLGKVSKPLYFKQSYSMIKWRTVILRNQRNHQWLNTTWYILTVFIRTQKVGSYNYAVEMRLMLQRSDRSPLQMLQ